MTELILKPQNSTGWLYTTTGDYTQYISDGNNFNSFSYPTSLEVTPSSFEDSDEVVESVLTTAPANGNWQGYYQTTFGESTIPKPAGQPKTIVGIGSLGTNGIELCSPAVNLDGGNNGVYQQVYGLTTGNDYSLTVSYNFAGSLNLNSELTLFIYDTSSGSPVLVDSQQILPGTPVSPATYDMPFTATSSELVIVINSWSQVAECINLTSVGITEAWEEVNYSLSDFNDGSVSLDLFEESIPLTLSVSDFTDAANNLQSYSKDFRLPSTKKNDKVFNHIYNLDSTLTSNFSSGYSQFNPYIKTIATVKEDNQDIFTGEFTLTAINKGAEGITYNVHLQSIVSGFAGVLEGRQINNLNLDELNHDYNSVNIKDSWDGNLSLSNVLSSDSFALTSSDNTKTSVIKYPFVNWVGNLDVDSSDNLDLNSLEEVYRPFISAKYLLDKIFDEANFNYDSAFLNSPNFTNLYMDCNWGEANAPIEIYHSGMELRRAADINLGTAFTDLDFDLSPVSTGNYTNFGYADGVFTAQVEGQSYTFDYDMDFSRGAGFDTLTVQIVVNDVVEVEEISASTNYNFAGTFTTTQNLSIGETIVFRAKSSAGTYELNGDSGSPITTLVDVITQASQSVSKDKLLALRGNMSQWDFIKSFMNMFNLLIMPTENPNRLSIEPYDTVFGLEGYQNLFPMDDNQVITGLVAQAGTTKSQTIDSITLTGDGTQSGLGTGIYRNQNHAFIDGETYVYSFDVTEYTLDNGMQAQLYNFANGFTEFTRIPVTGIGSYSDSFVYTTHGSNAITFKFRMLQSTGAIKLENLKMIGKFANDIVVKDWTNKVDEDTFAIDMQELDKEVRFGYTNDSDDYPNSTYSKHVQHNDGRPFVYGDGVYSQEHYTSLTNINKIDVSSFAATIVKPLNQTSAASDLIAPMIYAQDGEGLSDFTEFKNTARILYDNGVKTFSGTYSSSTQNTVAGFNNEDEYLQFSHFSELDNVTGAPSSALDYNFQHCTAIGFDNNTPNTLMSEFWTPYYGEKYHPDTRVISVDIFLSANDISEFNYTDVVRIKNQEFRINNINYQPQGMSKVNLIKLP